MKECEINDKSDINMHKEMIITVPNERIYDILYHKLGKSMDKIKKQYTKLYFIYDWDFKEKQIIIKIEGAKTEVEKFITLSKIQEAIMNNPAMQKLVTVKII